MSTIFAMRSKVVLLYGATERVIADGICNIGVFTRHVTLGFPRGADLKDPAGVLQGTGKAMRHITVKKLSELDRPEIRAFLRQARKHAGLKRRNPRTTAEVLTRVKPLTRRDRVLLIANWRRASVWRAPLLADRAPLVGEGGNLA